MNLRLAIGVVAVVAALTPPVPAQAQGSSTLDAVRIRGAVRCGVSTGLAGFALPDKQGAYSGLDVDACRAVAAAVFGDARRVAYVPLSAVQRFAALQSGEVDMLARNASWTLSRNAALGLDFVVTNFYDGQGFMVPKAGGVKRATELSGASICVQPGTVTEQNLADWFRARNIKYTPVVIEQLDQVTTAYLAGRCDAITSDQSQLVAIRSTAPNEAAHVILPDIISKEPLSVAVRSGEPGWANIVRWSVFAMIEAEELGLSARNIAERTNEPDPAIQRFVGGSGDLGKMLGLDNRWAFNIVGQVGNYAESFERNLVPLGIERGVNRLWKDGGILIAPPIR